MAEAGELENNWKAIPTPFGIHAMYGGGHGTIPKNEIEGSNKASWNKGFPKTTFQPNNAPSGGDFNTFNNIISGLLMNIQLGQAVNVYNLDYQNAQGGYPQGALIWANETSRDYTTRALFMSLVDNNLTVPSTANTATWKKLLPVEKPRNYLPDYNNKLSLSGVALPYTFPADGWLFANFVSRSDQYLAINDNQMLVSAWARDAEYYGVNLMTCMVSAGDVLQKYWTDGGTPAGGQLAYGIWTGAFYFIPFKS